MTEIVEVAVLGAVLFCLAVIVSYLREHVRHRSYRGGGNLKPPWPAPPPPPLPPPPRRP